MRVLALLVVFVIVAAPALPAQADLQAGDRVRLDLPSVGARRVTGEIIATRPDTLVLREDDGGQRWTIGLAEASRVWVSLGRRPRGELVRHDAGVGALAGAAIGVTAGAADGCSEMSGERCEPNVDHAVGGLVIGGALGGLLGAIVGLVRPSEEWIRLDPPLRVVALPARGGGLSLGITARF